MHKTDIEALIAHHKMAKTDEQIRAERQEERDRLLASFDNELFPLANDNEDILDALRRIIAEWKNLPDIEAYKAYNSKLSKEVEELRMEITVLRDLARHRANLARNQTAQIVLDLSNIVASGKTHKEKDLALHELFKSLAKLRDTYTLFESMFAVAKSMADDNIPF